MRIVIHTCHNRPLHRDSVVNRGLLLESTSRVRRALVGVAAAIIIVSLSARAFGQTSYWKNSETLWNHTLSVTSDNDVAHNNLGFLFLRSGELDKAISEFQTALDIRSRNTQRHYSLGAALIQNNMGNAFAGSSFGTKQSATCRKPQGCVLIMRMRTSILEVCSFNRGGSNRRSPNGKKHSRYDQLTRKLTGMLPVPFANKGMLKEQSRNMSKR